MEALFAELKNQIGLRRVRLRRLKFVREQFFLAAAVQNINGEFERNDVSTLTSAADNHHLWLSSTKELSKGSSRAHVRLPYLTSNEQAGAALS